jgi:A/G-specific adenine glycosylase
VLVSEVMLQQTQAGRVAAAFEPFLTRFPDVRALAGASRADVLRAWGGLGYPRRAVALHRAAREIVHDFGAVVPRKPGELQALPGVGPYTSAAVASIAYGERVPAVDTNVRRVWARVAHGAQPDEVPASALHADAASWLGEQDPRAWNQAVMDLGREICRPVPRCEACPLSRWCAFRKAGRSGRPSFRRQAPFEGSGRQVRGAVLRALLDRSPCTVSAVVSSTGQPAGRVVQAIEGLARDGVIEASAAALRGAGNARVRLPGD